MRVADVLALLAAGADEAEILADSPYLTDLRSCIGYAAAQANHAVVIASGACALRDRRPAPAWPSAGWVSFPR